MLDIDSEFQKTLDFLFSKLPFFSRDGKKSLKYSLDNVLALSNELGNPHLKFKSIHIAGTNGKGSTAHTISAVLQSHGYKTALYTSPHLVDFRERMRIDGKMPDKQFVIDFVNENLKLIENLKPSFFEITQMMAFTWFANSNVDIAVIETGLGGRLDSTNIIYPIISIITNVSYDHTDILGDTLEKIAFEKSGIIKENTPAVIGRKQYETKQVFEDKANSVNAKLYFADDLNLDLNYKFELKGDYQKENKKTILAALEILQKDCDFVFEKSKIQFAFNNIKELTGLRGRWEILSERNPKIVADTGHNEDGMKFIITQIANESFDKLHIVFGMLNDKKRDKILEKLPKNAEYYFCKPNVLRGLDENEMLAEAQSHGLSGKSYKSCEKALAEAIKNSNPNDFIYIGGSTFVVSELIDTKIIKTK